MIEVSGARGRERGPGDLLQHTARDIDVDGRPAVAWFEDALRIFREIVEPYGSAGCSATLAEEQFRAGDLEGAVSRATEAFNLGTRPGLLKVVAEARRVLAMVAARRGLHADAERLLPEVAAAHEQAGDRSQLALILTVTVHL